MAIDPYTPARDDWSRDDLPGFREPDHPEESKRPHCDRLAERLAIQGIRKRVTETRIEYRGE